MWLLAFIYTFSETCLTHLPTHTSIFTYHTLTATYAYTYVFMYVCMCEHNVCCVVLCCVYLYGYANILKQSFCKTYFFNLDCVLVPVQIKIKSDKKKMFFFSFSFCFVHFCFFFITIFHSCCYICKQLDMGCVVKCLKKKKKPNNPLSYSLFPLKKINFYT